MDAHPALELLRRGRGDEGVRVAADAASRAVLSGRLDAAERLLRDALELAPQAPTLLARLAGVRHLRGDGPAALALARAALRADPGESMAATLAIDALVGAGLAGEAAAIGEAAIARTPAASVSRALSQALLMMGRAPAALAQARTALAAAPRDAAAISTLCFTALYDDSLEVDALTRLHVEHAGRMPPAVGCPALAPRMPLAGRPLRVGILSPDLRDHPMGWFVEPLLRHLDRTQFELFAYARVAQPDARTAALRSIDALHWRDTHALDDAQVHRLIQDDAIDVLLDLAGHSAGGRPRLLAARAAPLQLSWLGYPHASGLPNMDGVVADAALVPGSSAQDSVAVLRLDGSSLCLPPARDAPAVSPLPSAQGAPFTFASFNHLAKLSDATLALWSRVLEAVPGSRLALCAMPLADAQVRRFTLARFVAQGVDARRVLLLPPRRPLAAFLAQYDAVDVALDPLPFNGGTTTLQALWQGVPVLSMPGASMQQRMGASILGAAGLQAPCLAEDAAHYVALAQALAAPRGPLLELRRGLRERLTPMLDARDFAARFGTALLRFASGIAHAHT